MNLEIRYELRLEPIGLDQENILQDIYNHSPTYFKRVDGTDPLPGMAKKDIEDIPQNRSKTYKKIAALIYKNSEPIGYADLHINHRTDGITYLGLLLLKESEQGKGIGRKAYLLVEKYLTEKFNIKKIVLGVSDKNQVQAYWEKMGFKPNGHTYIWKGERVESNVTEMEKSLEDQGNKK